MEKSNWVFVKWTKIMLTSGLAYKITSTLQFSIGAYMRQGFEPKKACRPVIWSLLCSVRCPVRSCDPWTVSIVPPAKGPFSGTILLSCGFWYENVCWDSPLSEPLTVMTTGPAMTFALAWSSHTILKTKPEICTHEIWCQLILFGALKQSV